MNEMQSDRAHRDAAIHWPAAYNPSVAPVFSHNELLIQANCRRTFTRLANAVDWPNWLAIVKDVENETPGNTGRGALYRLKIFGSPIQSRIVEFAIDQRVSWIHLVPARPRAAMVITTLGTLFQEVLNASSLQKKLGLDLGTAKIPPQEVTSCTKLTSSGSTASGMSANRDRLSSVVIL